MGFVSMLVRMIARQTIFGSGRKLINSWSNRSKHEELDEVDVSTMDSHQKRRYDNQMERKQQQSMTRISPWIYVLAIIIGILVLYILTQNK